MRAVAAAPPAGARDDTEARRAARRQRPARSGRALRGGLRSHRTGRPAGRRRATVRARVGQSTHAPGEIDAAHADYIGVGPVYSHADEGRPSGGRPRARPLCSGSHTAALVRDRRHRRDERWDVSLPARQESPSCAPSAMRPTPSAPLEPSGTRWASRVAGRTVLSDKTTTVHTYGLRLAGTVSSSAVAPSPTSPAQVGRHPATVGYWVHKYGLTLAAIKPSCTRSGRIDEPHALAKLVAGGLSVGRSECRLGVSQATVRHWLLEYGMETERGTLCLRSGGADVPIARDAGCDGLLSTPRMTPFRRRADGGWRCLECRAQARRGAPPRCVKDMLVAEAGGGCRALRIRSRSMAALQFHHRRRDREGVPDLCSVASRGRSLREGARSGQVRATVRQLPCGSGRRSRYHPDSRLGRQIRVTRSGVTQSAELRAVNARGCGFESHPRS